MRMFSRISSYITCILERDPAARSRWDVIFSYPSFHALLLHRIAHHLWNVRLFWLARWISHWGRFLTGIEIHPAAQIGNRVFIDHGMGVVIGETAQVGDDCTIYHGVTLGGTSLYQGKRHPTLGRGVIVGAGAKILGGFTVGDNAKVGSNAVVIKPVPAGATVVGNPAHVVPTNEKRAKSSSKAEFLPYGVTKNDDPISQALRELVDNASSQEQRIELLWQALEKISQQTNSQNCLPEKPGPKKPFDAGKLNDLINK